MTRKKIFAIAFFVFYLVGVSAQVTPNAIQPFPFDERDSVHITEFSEYDYTDYSLNCRFEGIFLENDLVRGNISCLNADINSENEDYIEITRVSKPHYFGYVTPYATGEPSFIQCFFNPVNCWNSFWMPRWIEETRLRVLDTQRILNDLRRPDINQQFNLNNFTIDENSLNTID